MYGLPDPHKSQTKTDAKTAAPGSLPGSLAPGSIPGLPSLDDPYGLGAMNSMFNPYGYNPAAAAALQMQLQYAAAAQNQMMFAGEPLTTKTDVSLLTNSIFI